MEVSSQCKSVPKDSILEVSSQIKCVPERFRTCLDHKGNPVQIYGGFEPMQGRSKRLHPRVLVPNQVRPGEVLYLYATVFQCSRLYLTV